MSRAPEPRSLRVGDVVDGYRVLGRLGEGAMGDVLHVRDPQGRGLALKLCRGDVTPDARERFAREGEITAALRHSGIVAVHARGVLDQRPYLVYELIEGQDLERAFPHLSREALLQATQEVAEAVGHAHAQGVIHRDLKPANVLLDASGRARVADFGMAQVAGLERLTATGALVGTPHYMAPEQVTGARELYGPHTDVWALGVLLFRVLTGRHPFQGRTLTEQVLQVARAPIPRPSSLAPDVPPALEAVCLRALEREPAARTPDGAAFAAELARARASSGRSADRGRGWLALSALCALGGLATLGAIALTPTTPAREAPPPAPASPLDELARALAAGDPAPIRAALGAAARADPPAARRALVQHARRALARDAAGFDATLALLAELDAAAPDDPAEAALANAGVARAWTAYGDAEAHLSEAANPERWGLLVARLQALAEAGLRADDPSAATISDTLRSQERLGVLDSMTYWAAIRACARLDLPCAPEVFRTTPGIGGAPRERPWDLDTREPWARYLEARIARARSVPGSDAALASALRGDFAELLGPVHWTQSALEVAAALSPREQRPWIEEAVQRAPALPLPWVYLAGIQLEEGHPQQALASLERATGILGSPGYAGAFATEASLRRAHHYTIVALAELGRRDEARALYRLHAGRNPSFAAPLLEPYPWLDD